MAPDKEPLVSVVSPIYNVERYLRAAIESVRAQTYQNWEYILVDNCSTDRTPEIAAEYGACDRRIRVCTNHSFVRALENYNIAIRQISPDSKYCKVLAGDDSMHPECLEKMVDLCERHPSVTIAGAYSARGTGIAWTGLHYSTTVMSGREVCRSLLLGGPYVFGTPSSVLYRADIVRSRYAFFNESNVHADTEVCCEFLEHSDFGFVHQVLTYLEEREDSMSAVMHRFNTFAPWGLYVLAKYGPKYLDDEELRVRTRNAFSRYYRYLGREVFMRRGKEFWDLHRKKLSELGLPLSKGRLAVAAAGFAMDAAVNPGRTIQGLIRQLT